MAKAKNKTQLKTDNLEKIRDLLRLYEQQTVDIGDRTKGREQTINQVFRLVRKGKLVRKFGSIETQGPFRNETILINVDGRQFPITESSVVRSTNDAAIENWFKFAKIDLSIIHRLTLTNISDSARQHNPGSIAILDKLSKRRLVAYPTIRQIKIPSKKKK